MVCCLPGNGRVRQRRARVQDCGTSEAPLVINDCAAKRAAGRSALPVAAGSRAEASVCPDAARRSSASTDCDLVHNEPTMVTLIRYLSVIGQLSRRSSRWS
jgi:hypothetical protein